MWTVKNLAKAVGRLVSIAFLGVSILAMIVGLFADIPGEALWSLTREQIFGAGLLMSVIFVVIIFIRHELLLQEFSEMWANEPARRLLQDGIPPYRSAYFPYVRSGDFATVKRFWDAGMANVADHYGQYDLHIACEAGHAAIVRGLIERGGDPKRPNKNGQTPLILAAIHGRIAVVEVLLEHDSAINARASENGVSALYAAAALGHLPVVQLLLNARADPNTQDDENITPLMAAIARQHHDIARLLISRGADLSRVDKFGATIVDYCREMNGPPEIAAAAAKAGVVAATPPMVNSGSASASAGKINVIWRRDLVRSNVPAPNSD